MRVLLVVFLIATICSSSFAAIISANTWVQISDPDNPPTSRESHSAVYNDVNNTIVVFGGQSQSVVFSDISKFDIVSDSWLNNIAADGTYPLGRFGHTASVGARYRMIVFGGRNETDFHNDVSVYDLVKDAWISVTVSGTAPSARAYHTAAVDKVTNALIIYGGVDSSGSILSDMYRLDLTSFVWSTVNPVNSTSTARAYHTAVTTPLNVMVIFGGFDGKSYLNDVWCFHITTSVWDSCLQPSNTNPDLIFGHSAVISGMQQMVVFGGKNSAGTVTNDVWNLDLTTFTWGPVVSGGISADPRAYHSATATPFGAMVVFGGLNSDGSDINNIAIFSTGSTILRSANDGAVMVVLISLVGTIMISLCFALDYMQEQSSIEKQKAIAKMKAESDLLLPKLKGIPSSLQIPMGPGAKKFFDEFKHSLDPLHEPPAKPTQNKP